jgi:hypothetical protein
MPICHALGVVAPIQGLTCKLVGKRQALLDFLQIPMGIKLWNFAINDGARAAHFHHNFFVGLLFPTR